MENIKIMLDKRKEYSGDLPCPNDKTSLLHHCVKNAVLFVEGMDGLPENIWEADLYKCPTCHNLVLTDFGNVPQWTKENTQDLQVFIEGSKARGAVIIYHWRRAAA